MKKFALLPLLFAFLVLFSACASGDAPAEPSNGAALLDAQNPVSLEIWHYYNGPQKTAFDEMIVEFNETVGREQGIIVEAFSQGNVNDLIANVMDAVNQKVGASDVPDIFAAYADTAFEVDKLGLVANLDDYLTAEELAEYRAEFIAEGRIGADGSLKIFPIAKSVELTMINLTDWQRFATATGHTLDDLATMEGVTATAAAYYEWSGGQALFGRDALANYFVIGSRQLGVEIFGSEDGAARINADEAVLRQLWQHYYEPFVQGHFGAFGRFRSDDLKIGQLIAFVGSSRQA